MLGSFDPATCGPYERAVRDLVDQADRSRFRRADRTLALGCPPWLAAKVADEAGTRLRPSAGGNCVAVLADITVIGSPGLDGPGVGTMLIRDLINGWWHDVETVCHPDVPPDRWPHLTLAVAAGLNPNAAVGLADIVMPR